MMILKSIEGQSRYGSTRGARCVQACVGCGERPEAAKGEWRGCVSGEAPSLLEAEPPWGW